MIRTAADLIEALMRREAEVLAAQEISHPGMIGEMYEGLAKHLVGLVIPDATDLSVTSGVIVNQSGQRSRQIDCMVVQGEGRPIPYTSHHEYLDRNVVAVIEVKKNLYSKDVESAYGNLASVFDVCEPYVSDGGFRLLEHAFRGIAQRILPSPLEARSLPLHLEMIYHSLTVETYKPLRVVLGYDGFTSEFGLRKAYIQFVQENVLRSGYSPARFPNLIICGKYSLIKIDGMPYSAPLRGDMWTFYASTSSNPILLLLELLYTRLTYAQRISPDVFGEDLTVESFHPLLEAICVALPDSGRGWVIRSVDLGESELDGDTLAVPWQPALLNEVQVAVVSRLCLEGSIPLCDAELAEFLRSHNYTVEALISELQAQRLVTVDRGALTMLTDRCDIVVTPDGSFYAAENNSGRLTRWVMRRMEKSQGEP